MNDNSPAVRPVSGIGGIELRPLMRAVYAWMTLALGITGTIAFVLAKQLEAQGVEALANFSSMFVVLLVVQLGLAFGLSFFINRMNPTLAAVLFIAYSVVMGVSMSAIIFGTIAAPEVDRFGNYTMVADWAIVYKAFFTTAGVFGAMTVIGYTTKVDLSRFSSFFIMGLVGLLIATVVNMFLRSDGLDFILTIAGVLLFVGITAWDTQKIKQMAEEGIAEGSDDFRRIAILGAFNLYLDFINLFIRLLQLYARARD